MVLWCQKETVTLRILWENRWYYRNGGAGKGVVNLRSRGHVSLERLTKTYQPPAFQAE